MRYANQQGQVIILILLVVTIVLALGLSVVGRSIHEVTTAERIEESSKAFTASEAGLEKAIAEAVPSLAPQKLYPTNHPDYVVSPQFSVTGADRPGIGQNYFYPYKVDKNGFAQLWLANPDPAEATQGVPNEFYDLNNFYLHFGKPSSTGYQAYNSETGPYQPAISVHVIVWDNAVGHKYYVEKKYYIDPDGVRNTNTHDPDKMFDSCTDEDASLEVAGLTPRTHLCRALIDGYMTDDSGNPINGWPIMARIRLLYASESHPVAIELGTGADPDIDGFPPQEKYYTSTGTAGTTERVIRVSRLKRVMPYIFDFALFSNGTLTKD